MSDTPKRKPLLGAAAAHTLKIHQPAPELVLVLNELPAGALRVILAAACAWMCTPQEAAIRLLTTAAGKL